MIISISKKKIKLTACLIKSKICHMVFVKSYLNLVKFLNACSRMENQTDLEDVSMIMVIFTLECGRKV